MVLGPEGVVLEITNAAMIAAKGGVAVYCEW